jgi:hypothetical protein
MIGGTALLRRMRPQRTWLAALVIVGACNNAGHPPGPSPISQVMDKVAKTQDSLGPLIGRELRMDPPPWDTIRPQAKELTELAASLAGYDPPRGSKESWAKQTSSYADAAASLERAAQAKDKDAALAAHTQMNRSCMDCHRDHRGAAGK